MKKNDYYLHYSKIKNKYYKEKYIQIPILKYCDVNYTNSDNNMGNIENLYNLIGGTALERGEEDYETADERDEKEYDEDGGDSEDSEDGEGCTNCHVKVVVDTIHIKDGPRLYAMYPNPDRPISEFKELIIQKLEKKDIDLEGELILSLRGNFLEDDKTLNYYRIRNGDLVLAFDEGATLDKPEYTERERNLDKYHTDPYYGPFRRVSRNRRTKLIVTPKDKKDKND